MRFGVMQGRLLPRPYPKLKSFPYIMWKEEFDLAAELELFCMEWVFEAERYEENPIWTETGRKEICRLIKSTGVTVPSLCADYFLARPLHQKEGYNENIKVFNEIIQKAAEIGVSLLLMPVLEEAEIRTPEDQKRLVNAVESCQETLISNNMRLGLETEMPAADYLEFVQAFGSKRIGAYYDTGNSACRGFDMQKDLEILMPVLFGVHLKDRLLNGGSTYIGLGNTNFKEGIPFLMAENYSGQLIFESFYENDPVGTMRRNIETIRAFMGEIS